MMKVEFVSRQIIKPSSPTPQSHATFKLYYKDQMNIDGMYTTILLFYPNIDQCEANKVSHHHKIAEEWCERLKTSLSETLTYFYPLAGRIKDNAIIECKDQGVEFCKARVHGFLEDILKQPNNESMKQFMPGDDAGLGSGFLLKVQVNLFDCGGMVIGVSVSHKIADASTIVSFIKAWSCTAFGCMTAAMLPKYNIFRSFYASMDSPIAASPITLGDFINLCITRRFVFDSSKITKLKAKAANNIVEQPSRVEAVLALIWKCAIIASRTSQGITKRPSMVSQAVNLRKRTRPPLPETSVGNFISHVVVKLEETNESTDIDLKWLVLQQRNALEQFSKKCLMKLQDRDAFSLMSEAVKEIELEKEGRDFYMCSSWCNFAFYEVDFGWGKPKWVSLPPLEMNNLIILMDTSDGKGVEAWTCSLGANLPPLPLPGILALDAVGADSALDFRFHCRNTTVIGLWFLE
ncbi:stemmadenine O-acetyltransferase-like [Prosopis cineraria]|uniref:stemmadenine O-acetyltransferase-like n=1 Tax=Prosopis cineraria TaxID=364024 RepID=UPI00241087B1|nr:stemmadenine O-acetyltransferase-like [Prosopis cineraria]